MIRIALYRGTRKLRFRSHGTDTIWFEGGREWSAYALGWILFVNVWW